MNKTSRRCFLQSITLGIASLNLLPRLSLAKADTKEKSEPTVKAMKQVVILHDQAHFDETGVFEAYIPPKNMSATREYVNSLDTETFLSRHWFV